MSSRARSRVTAIVAAIPLLIAGGPVFSASAEDGPVSQATMVKTLGDYRVGPNAGFRGDVSRGVSGTTAVMKLDVAESAVLNSLVVKLSADRAFSVYQSFNSNDGFALYKDTDGDGLLDPAEHAAGPVTQPGYAVGAEPGAAVITLTGDPAKATGAARYLLTVHPSTNQLNDRTFTVTVPTGGLQTSAGNLPLSEFALPGIVVDSMPPTLIPAGNFTAISRIPADYCPPGSAAGACGPDGYKVYRGGTPAETGEMLGFFNAAGDVSDGALLVVNATTPALYSVPTIPASINDALELSIGNGTGRDPNVPTSRALNNQLSDNVYVSQWDQMGNIASHAAFSNDTCDPANAAACPAPLPARGNDVTGPKLTTQTIKTFNNVNVDTANKAAVPVVGSTTGLDAARPANRPQGQVRQVVNVRRYSNEDAVIYDGIRAWSAPFTPNSTTTAQDITTLVDLSSNANYPSPSRIRGIVSMVDAAGNTNAPLTSALKYRDLVAPKITSISLLDTVTQNGLPDPGEQYRVVFDDPMDSSKVTAANVNANLDPDNLDGTGECDPTNPASDFPCPYWGDAPSVSWSTDARALTITLGEPSCDPDLPACPPGTERLAQAGDEVAAATTVTDLAGNKVSNPNLIAIIDNPFVQVLKATTADTLALTGPAVFNTGRDGVIDSIDVLFTGPMDSDSITTASDGGKFTVEVPGGGNPLAATATPIGGGATVTGMRLTFEVPANNAAFWGTASAPVVKMTDGELTSGEQTISNFTVGAGDGAPPVPVSIKTQDSTADGKIDKVLVKFSEAVQAGKENECGYTVSGYSSTTYIPPSAGTAAQPRTCPTSGRNAVAAVAGQPDTVALTLTPKAVSDTDARPLVAFSSTNQVPAYDAGTGENGTDAPECNPNASLIDASTPNCPVLDAKGNGLPAFSGIASDAAVPVIVARATGDGNADGHIDRLTATFSEPLDTPSVFNAQFQITDPAYTIRTLNITPGNDAEIRITVDQTSTRTGDTSEKPKLQFLGGATDVADPANTAPADAAGVVVADKAGPAIMNACVAMTVPGTVTAQEKAARLGKCPEGAGDKMAVTFSEALDTTAGVVIPADFVVEQPAGTAKTVATVASVANAADGKSSIVTLTFGTGQTLDATQPAFVRLSAAGVVNDNAAPTKNASTQLATITAFAAPSVSLDLTCPVASNPGYCSAQVIDTGAAGNAGVTGWRIVDSAVQPGVPAAGDFSPTQPTTYPTEGVLTEGAHTLWLRGKDDFDRMSEEKSASITILKAPKILNVQMVNKTVGRPDGWSKSTTVSDGDNILIGGDAYGTDAAEWAANSAPTGGGCLAQHMSVDLRALTGKLNDSAVKPLTCDLKTATTPPYRQMQFPVVKVLGTTKYPVGTVVRVSTADAGSMIVDGPNGTQRRRQFISAAARRSWMVSDASVITIPSAMMASIPRTTNLGYRDGAVLRSPSGGYYYMHLGTKRAVSTRTLSAWRIPTSTAYPVSVGELNATPSASAIGGAGHQIGTWIKYSNGTIYQIVRKANGATARRQLAAGAALRTRVPSSQVYPANSYDSQLPVDSWLLGYRDGTIVKLGTNSYGVFARGVLRKFSNAQTFNTLGYSTSNALAFSGSATSRVRGASYLTGLAINRYLMTSVVIKVTNKAGAVVTAVVTPAVGGVYGVGQVDPIPAGWDMTR